MLACEMATVACARDFEQPGVELQADQEHVQDDADLRDDLQRRLRVSRQDERRRFRPEVTQAATAPA